MSWWPLLGVIVLAQTIETALGFGATIVALALGIHFVPLEDLVPALAMLGVGQSLWLALRGRRSIDWRVLFLRILPIAAIGFPVGIVCGRLLDATMMRVILGGLVLALAIRLPAKIAPVAAAGGGFFHGLLGTGGPLIVVYAGRELPDKARFRATLAVLWLILNSILLLTLHDRVARVAIPTAMLVPALVAGIALGEFVYAKAPQRLFRVGVYILLVGIGLLLCFKS